MYLGVSMYACVLRVYMYSDVSSQHARGFNVACAKVYVCTCTAMTVVNTALEASYVLHTLFTSILEWFSGPFLAGNTINF